MPPWQILNGKTLAQNKVNKSTYRHETRGGGSQKLLLVPGRKRKDQSMVSARNVISLMLEARLEGSEHTFDSRSIA